MTKETSTYGVSQHDVLRKPGKKCQNI